ncbi:HCP-like protein, partial [Linderina pennispora]
SLVNGSSALDMYREAAKKTQDQRIQLEYAKFLLQSVENLQDPAAREDFNQATEIDPANRDKLISEAVYWIKHLQRKGNTEASYIAGTWFESGKYGIELDKSKALQLFTYAAKNHHAAAAYKVAVHQEDRKQTGRAFSYYQMAAALGDVSANYRMAKVFLDGALGKKPNPKQALIYLRRAAELANEECPYGALLLGLMYLGEYANPAVYETVFVDAEEAQKLLDKAARLGSADAQYKLGHLFEFGEHQFPVDPFSSIHYYQLAAEQDNPEAQMALSGWYLSGAEGVLNPDDQLTFDWGHRAAQQGLPRAEFAMGYYYEMGIGCEKNINQAKDWYERAAHHGSEEAKERL